MVLTTMVTMQMFLIADDKKTYQFDELDSVTNKSHTMELTQSVSERQGKGKMTEASHVKLYNVLFCLCVLMFCTND